MGWREVNDGSKEPFAGATIAHECDKSTRVPVLAAFYIALAWLAVGTLLGDLASLKLNLPDLWTSSGWLTFGRVRPAHLNTVIYGWASNAMLGVAIWLMSRLVRTPLNLAGRISAIIGVGIWNFGVFVGVLGILMGSTDGMEWLEMSRFYADPFLIIGGGFVALSIWSLLYRQRVSHLYVSVWYLGAALLWFPFIFFIGNYVGHRGVINAAVNWYFAHNALGLWITAVGLAAVYYFIPKVLGRPIYSYWLSLLGFWALAFFYSLNGMHHLIGGPLPSWMIATSIVASIMMVIPVVTVAVNHHMTMVGRFSALRYSPTLSFIVLGAMAYTGVSLQGVMQALVEVNRVTHFTHWTIAHAHMGVYAFATFVLFGSMYYILPRLVGREWPSGRLIRWHFWLVLVGIFLYIFGLAIGGVLQGIALNNPTVPFAVSVQKTIPWLWVRTFAGLVLTAGHFVFIYHVYRLVSRSAGALELPPWHEVTPIVVDASGEAK